MNTAEVNEQFNSRRGGVGHSFDEMMLIRVTAFDAIRRVLQGAGSPWRHHRLGKR